MKAEDRKQHWNTVYQSKNQEEASWFQPRPVESLDLIEQSGLPKSASIIDIGGGDSLLVDHLLALGYTDISVLDISEKALNKARRRLGSQAKQVRWINKDATSFSPQRSFDLWHDRATFHFLTDERDISSYISNVQTGLRPGGYLIIGTFSEQGPDHCSGLPVRQYSETGLSELFGRLGTKIQCRQSDHKTPSGKLQNFIYCMFKRS